MKFTPYYTLKSHAGTHSISEVNEATRINLPPFESYTPSLLTERKYADMKQKYTPTEDEVACFRELMDGVQRIHSDKVEHQFPKPLPIPVQTLNDEAMVMRNLLNTAHGMIEVQPGDSLEYIRAGLPKSVMGKLRKGQYRTQSELDLHGMTAVETLQALSRFMQKVCGSESCCVRIIHGKGRGSSNRGPVLKSLVYHWLKKRDEVLAFTSARPVDGGTGALYVLLKWRSKQ